MSKISELLVVTTLDGTELVPMVKDGVTVAVALSTIIPPGGTTGQVLAKASNGDYDLEWITP